VTKNPSRVIMSHLCGNPFRFTLKPRISRSMSRQRRISRCFVEVQPYDRTVQRVLPTRRWALDMLDDEDRIYLWERTDHGRFADSQRKRSSIPRIRRLSYRWRGAVRVFLGKACLRWDAQTRTPTLRRVTVFDFHTLSMFGFSEVSVLCLRG